MKGGDLYEILGVTRSATPEDIRRAFRVKAIELHPDKHGGDPRMEQAFKRLNAAYRVLSDPSKKAAYDDLLSELPDSSRPPTRASPPRNHPRGTKRRSAAKARDQPSARPPPERPRANQYRREDTAHRGGTTSSGWGTAIGLVAFLISSVLGRAALRSCADPPKVVETATPTEPAPTRDPSPLPTVQYYWVVNAPSGLNLRVLPSTDVDLIATMIPQGARVQASGRTAGRFAEVSYEGHSGWAAADFLSAEPPTTTASTALSSKTGAAPARLTAAVNNVLPEARRCMLPWEPPYSARIVFQSDGSVQSVVVTDGPPYRVSEHCIVEALKTARAPPFQGAAPPLAVTVQPL